MRLYSAAWYLPSLRSRQNCLYSCAGPVGRLDEQAVVLALDLLQAIAEHLEEILVGGDDGAVEVELDDRLGLVDGVELAAQVRIPGRGRRVRLGG